MFSYPGSHIMNLIYLQYNFNFLHIPLSSFTHCIKFINKNQPTTIIYFKNRIIPSTVHKKINDFFLVFTFGKNVEKLT